jgi:hypothetical protein
MNTALTAQQLRDAADLKERMDALQNELNDLLGGEVSPAAQAATQEPGRPKNGRRKKRRMTPAWKRALALAREARLAKLGLKAAAEPEQPVKRKRNISAAGRRAMSLAGKRRWAKARRAGQSRL